MDTNNTSNTTRQSANGGVAPGGGPVRRQANKNGQRYSRISFTINNWTQQEYDALMTNTFKYMCIGKEVGAAGTPHLQCCAVLARQTALSTLKTLPGLARAHIESMYGSVEKNQKYCSKDGDWIEVGSLPEPGKRTDLNSLFDEIKAGKSFQELVESEHCGTLGRFHKAAMFIKSYSKPAPKIQPKVIWIHGGTGVGKTGICTDWAERNMDGDYWISNGDLRWFDGYCGQRVAILDELRYPDCSTGFLLRLLDRYRFRVPFKGGFVDWTPLVIFITCPLDPRIMYAGVTNDAQYPDQLCRRISLCIDVGDNDNIFENEEIWSEVCKGITDCVLGLGQTEEVQDLPPTQPYTSPISTQTTTTTTTTRTEPGVVGGSGTGGVAADLPQAALPRRVLDMREDFKNRQNEYAKAASNWGYNIVDDEADPGEVFPPKVPSQQLRLVLEISSDSDSSAATEEDPVEVLSGWEDDSDSYDNSNSCPDDPSSDEDFVHVDSQDLRRAGYHNRQGKKVTSEDYDMDDFYSTPPNKKLEEEREKKKKDLASKAKDKTKGKDNRQVKYVKGKKVFTKPKK